MRSKTIDKLVGREEDVKVEGKDPISWQEKRMRR